MMAKLEELLSTGKLQQSEHVLDDPRAKALMLFSDVHGIGPVLGKKLVDQGFTTLEELRQHPVAETMLSPAAVLGLKYFEDSKRRIDYDEIEVHLQWIQTCIKEHVDANLVVACCGSHRRGLPTSGDMDLLLTHPSSATGNTYTYLASVVHR